jgi:transposase
MEYAVCLHLQVRRFFCANKTCPRKTFAECFPDLAAAYARRTNRQATLLCAVAIALGGKPGVPISEKLNVPVSLHTLLRMLHRTQVPPTTTPRVLGVDDWSIHKGQTYGTLLVDLERHRVVDVLPDREADTFESWLKSHPGVEVISRDRAGTYAQAARKGAPNATQVADRFHLFLNLQEALTRLFERKHEQLEHLAASRAEERRSVLSRASAETQVSMLPLPFRPLTSTETHRQARRAKRQSRYETVKQLHEQGVSQVAIAIRVGLDRDTVRRYIRSERFPEIVRPGRRSHLDPYKGYLHERWAAGQRNIKHLLREIRAQGYRAGETIVYDYLRGLREPTEGRAAFQRSTHTSAHDTLSARAAAWLFLCNPRKLRLPQVVSLDQLRRADEALELTYQLAQDFRMMVAKRQEGVLNRWLMEAKGSGIAELRSFAASIVRDFDAVQAALRLPYSNGQTEGKVNKLKNLKRQMYGRADFELLRQRMLHCA